MDRKEYIFDDGIRWVTATPNPPYKKCVSVVCDRTKQVKKSDRS